MMPAAPLCERGQAKLLLGWATDMEEASIRYGFFAAALRYGRLAQVARDRLA